MSWGGRGFNRFNYQKQKINKKTSGNVMQKAKEREK